MSQQTLGATTSFAGGGVVVDLPTKTLTQPTFTFAATGGVEDITDLTFTAQNNDIDASLDMTNTTSPTLIIRLIEEPDGTNARQIKEWEWPTDNDSVNDAVLKISIIGHGVDVKVTIDPSSDQDGLTIPIAIAEYVY